VQEGQRKCGSEMPPCADANRDGLLWPSLGESLAVFKPQVCNCGQYDRMHGSAGAKAIRNGIKDRAKAGRRRCLPTVKYVVSHQSPIGGRHTWNRSF